MQITPKNVLIGLGVGALAVGVLAACSTEKDADTFALDEFGDFDRRPKDNNWTPDELTRTFERTRSREVNTYRVGDYIHGTREYLRTTTTESMQSIFNAAKGNDAVLSLQELRQFALGNYDKDANGTLSSKERKLFDRTYGVDSYSRTQVIDREPFFRHSPRQDYPDPSYPDPGYPSGPTGPGDDGGHSGPTGPGDDNGGGGYTPPPNNGGGQTGGGDDNGGSHNPPPNNGGGNGGNGNSTDNGNPDLDQF